VAEGAPFSAVHAAAQPTGTASASPGPPW
jgi:hypothetical protein